MGRLIDRETVIKALEYCKRKDGNECKVCPYTESEYCVEDMVTDALALLKEQDAVKPTLIREGWNKHHNNYVCPRCDNDVFYEQNYCTECGVQFLWEGR